MKNSAKPESEKNPRIMPAEPVYLRAETELNIQAIPKTGVDRKNNVINGYVVALEGPLKSRRGEFDELSLHQMADVINSTPNGIKVRWTHPSLSDDGLGTVLGRSRNGRVETALTREGVEKLALRADLHFNPTALKSPPKGGGTPFGEYVMDLAESDSDLLSSSVVIPYEGLKEEARLDAEGKPVKDEQGRELPPLWRVSKLHASDIVDAGDAVDGLLSENLPDAEVRLGCELLDRVFGGQPLDVTVSRSMGWLRKYINLRYGPEASLPGDEVEGLKADIEFWKAEAAKEHALLVEAEKVQEKYFKENESLRAENIQNQVTRIFDIELNGKVYPGERQELLTHGIDLRKAGNESGFEIFIKSLKARDKKGPDLEEIAGNAGHQIVIELPPEQYEEKQEVSGFLMP